MEIHSRYYSATENQSTTSDFDELSNRLFRLMKENRIKDVLSLFQSVPSDLLYRLVNERNSQYDNDGPLNFAIKNSANHLVLIMLLRLGARISDNGDSALFTAVRAGLLNLVKILLISGANVNVLDSDGYSILHWACFRMNTLMVRLILQVGNFALHNNDRNKKRISPLGIAIELNSLELAKELLQCKEIDPNLIDSKSHEYLYDLAAESKNFRICLELEKSFCHNNPQSSTRRNFHDLHKYRIEAVIQHQLRSRWLTFCNDPNGAFQSYQDPSTKLHKLPEFERWQVVREESSMDSGWTWSFKTDTNGNALVVKDNQVVKAGGLFSYIDNYRFRLLARIHTNKLI